MTELKLPVMAKINPKKVEHCVFQWSVRNFSLCKRQDAYRICSSHFKLDPCSSTLWYLELLPGGRSGKEEGIALHLVRCVKDEGPQKVHAYFDFKVSFSNEEIFCEDGYECFQNDSRHGCYDIDSIDSLLKNIVEDDTLSITCDVCVINEGSAKKSKLSSPDYHYRCLSRDLRNFQTKEEFNDVVLKLSDGEIKGNKLVLSARSLFFRDILEHNTSNPSEIELPSVELKEMEDLLTFMYTGDFYLVSTKESSSPLSLYESAIEFNIADLKSMLEPNKVTAHSIIRADRCEFIWKIEDFILSDQDRYDNTIESPLFGTCCGSAMWILKLYKRSEASPDSIAIFVESCSNTDDNYLSIEISLLDEKGRPQNTSQAVEMISAYGRCGFPKFVERKLLDQDHPRLNINHTITIQCKLKLASGRLSSTVENNLISSPDCLNGYRKLSKDFGKLYETGFLSDLTLVANGKDFKVHRFVLCARSKFFAGKLTNQINSVLNLENADVETFDIFLKYIYSGKIPAMDLELTLQLLNLSSKLHVKPLIDECSSVIESKLQVETVCEIFTLADLHQNFKLKKTAMEYICSNAELVLVTDHWQKMIKTKAVLAAEVLSSLAESFRSSLQK